MASLFVIQGRDQGRRFDLEDDVVSIGRDTVNLIQLHDTEVSRRHAEIRKDGNGLVLVDLESSNGTFVNDAAIKEYRLRSGDRLLIGRTLMIYTAADDSSVLDLAGEADIVGQEFDRAGSRIVKSISQEEGSQILEGSGVPQNSWLERARSNLQIMYRTALAVSHTLDIDQLLSRIVELIFEWVEADRGCVMLVDPRTSQLRPKVTRHRRRRAGEEKQKLVISRTILDYVMERGQGVLTSDAREDERWDPAASILKMGVREAICVPMQGRYGVVGAIYIDTYTAPGLIVQRSANKFSEEHLKLMVAIGHQAALAVEDTSYYIAMVQAERLAAIGQTIATLSHHIKNILQGIRGGSYLIEEGLKGEDSEVVRKGWTIVEKNQEKISNLVMDMLTFSKEREPDLTPSDLQELVEDVVELMQVRASEAGVELVKIDSGPICELQFDPELMHRAVLNVVTNAIDACENAEDAKVTVEAEYDAEQGLARIHVRDNGAGIAEHDLKKVFALFESRKGSRGTGLGLPVSQKILREHGGEIRVQSKLGDGSTFTLEFPAVRPDTSGGSATLVDHPPR